MRAPRLTVLTAFLAFTVFGPAACRKAKIKPAQSGADLSQVVARVDDVVVTVGDLQERINKQSPFIRARYTTVEKKKEFLDNIIRFEVMAKEAEKKGYDKDPDVVRSMKQQMITKFMQKEFDAKMKIEDVPDVEVEKYYKEHGDEFNRPDEVRVSQIFCKEEAMCKKAAAEAKALEKLDQKAFRDMVGKYSEDEDSKARGGDLTFFDKDSSMFAREIREAAFALGDIGDVSAPVQTAKGWHVLKLTQKRPGFSRPVAEVKRQIQQKVFRDVRQKAQDDFVVEMKKHIKVEIYDDKLGKVLVDTGMTPPAAAPAGGGAAAAGAGRGPGPGGPHAPHAGEHGHATGAPPPAAAPPAPAPAPAK